MTNVLYAEINVVGICLLLIILFNQRQGVGASTLQRSMSQLIYATILMMVIDTLCRLLDGAAFPHARILKTAAESFYFVFNIFIPYLWVAYVEGALSKNRQTTVRRLRLLTVPMLLLFALIAVNLFTPCLFFIDENNVYHREMGYLAFAVGAYAYLGYASVRALRAARRAGWKEEKRRYYAMAFFIIPPGIGGIVQTFIYGVTLIWIFVALSTMLLYIDILNRQISSDPLTGINNRRELTKYILRETRDSAPNGILALIMMDVDNFKQVNDTCGHYYGDRLLVAVSEVLKQSCKNTQAFLARYGGDEFCIVYPAKNTRAVEGIIAGILQNVDEWNAGRGESPAIGLSIGYSIWRPETNENVDSLYKRADQEMYRVKSAKKNA